MDLVHAAMRTASRCTRGGRRLRLDLFSNDTATMESGHALALMQFLQTLPAPIVAQFSDATACVEYTIQHPVRGVWCVLRLPQQSYFLPARPTYCSPVLPTDAWFTVRVSVPAYEFSDCDPGAGQPRSARRVIHVVKRTVTFTDGTELHCDRRERTGTGDVAFDVYLRAAGPVDPAIFALLHQSLQSVAWTSPRVPSDVRRPYGPDAIRLGLEYIHDQMAVLTRWPDRLQPV